MKIFKIKILIALFCVSACTTWPSMNTAASAQNKTSTEDQDTKRGLEVLLGTSNNPGLPYVNRKLVVDYLSKNFRTIKAMELLCGTQIAVIPTSQQSLTCVINGLGQLTPFEVDLHNSQMIKGETINHHSLKIATLSNRKIAVLGDGACTIMNAQLVTEREPISHEHAIRLDQFVTEHGKQKLVTACGSGGFSTWDVTRRKKEKNIEIRTSAMPFGVLINAIACGKIDNKNKLVVAGAENNVRIYDLETYVCERIISIPRSDISQIRYVTFLNNGNSPKLFVGLKKERDLITHEFDEAHIYNAQTGAFERKLKFNRMCTAAAPYTCNTLKPTVILGHADGEVTLHDFSNSEKILKERIQSPAAANDPLGFLVSRNVHGITTATMPEGHQVIGFVTSSGPAVAIRDEQTETDTYLMSLPVSEPAAETPQANK